jgi:hypothetical protein
MNTIRELTDIELNEVAGGIGVIAIGTITGGTHNQAVVGVNAPSLSVAGGGIGNSNVAAGNDGAWIANIL